MGEYVIQLIHAMPGWMYNHVAEVFAIVFFVAGLCVGSFLNVVICRLPYNLSLLWPPSSCPKCAMRIPLWLNLPIISWLWLRGRCRVCRLPIPLRYPLVELFTGLLWAYIAYQQAVLDMPFWPATFLLVAKLAFTAAMIVAAATDFEHFIIPNEINYGGTLLSLAFSYALLELQPYTIDWLPGSPYLNSFFTSLLGAFVGGIVMYAVYLLGNLLLRRQITEAQGVDPGFDSAVGLGDVKLMIFFGAFLGWQGALLSLALGAVIGALFGVPAKFLSGHWPEQKTPWPQALRQRWQSGFPAIPFGPPLIAAALIYMLYPEVLINIFLLGTGQS